MKNGDLEQIRVVLNVDKVELLAVSELGSVEDAIVQEMGWLETSGLTVRKWEFVGSRDVALGGGRHFQVDVCFEVDGPKVVGHYDDVPLDEAIARELSWLGVSGMGVDNWRYTGPSVALNFSGDTKKQVYGMFLKLQEMRGQNMEALRVAQDMDWLQYMAGVDVDEAYCLAWKLHKASAQWKQPLAREAALQSLYGVLKDGLANDYFGISLSPKDTLELLIYSDVNVFGLIVEAEATRNYFGYDPAARFAVSDGEMEKLRLVANKAKGLIGNIDNLIAQSSESRYIGSSGEKKSDIVLE